MATLFLKKAVGIVPFRHFCGNLRSLRNASIFINPPSSMMDEKVEIKIQDLQPNQDVTLKVRQSNGINLNFESVTNYKADKNGIVDLKTAKPIDHPFYNEPDPMGPFWSAVPMEGSDKRFWSQNVMDGIRCDFSIFEGHIKSSETAHEPIGTASCHRHFVKPETKRIPVKEGRVRGTIFVPPGEGPFPAVVFMYGGLLRGNVIEDKAALMSSYGFVTMTLAFFGVDDEVLPKTYGMEPLNMDICEEAIDYLRSFKEVKKDKGVGLCGISKAGEVVLSMGAFLPDDKVSAVMTINSMVNYFMTGVEYKDKLVLMGYVLDLEQILKNVDHVGPDLINIQRLFDSLPYEGSESTIPFNLKKNTDYFLVIGLDDQLCRSNRALNYGIQLLKESGHSKYETKTYEDLGHLCDLPYSPVSAVANHALFPKPTMMQMGGDRRPGHVKGQKAVWEDGIAFFKSKL